MAEQKKTINLTIPILVVLLMVASGVIGAMWMKMKNPANPPKVENGTGATPQPTSEPLPTTIGNFMVTKEEICQEDGRPIIYFFGSSSCPHCIWSKPIMARVNQKFGKIIAYHENIDSQADQEVIERFKDINPGYVPFFVFGCKYVRVGSGETSGEASEEKNLTALICKLTNNQPEKVCSGVKDLIEQIK